VANTGRVNNEMREGRMALQSFSGLTCEVTKTMMERAAVVAAGVLRAA